jgi:hypothetical protein
VQCTAAWAGGDWAASSAQALPADLSLGAGARSAADSGYGPAVCGGQSMDACCRSLVELLLLLLLLLLAVTSLHLE